MIFSAERGSPPMMLRCWRLITAVLIFIFVVELQRVDCSKSFAEIIDNNNSRVESLKNVNFLVGIAERGVSLKNESSIEVRECVKDLKVFLEAVEANEIWAIKLIDAFGNMPRSFIWGNNFWFSSGELCSDVSEPFYISLSSNIPRATSGNLMNATSPYKMHLQMIYFNYTSSLQLDLKQQYQPYIEIGLCVSAKCPKEAIVSWTEQYFKDKRYGPQLVYDIDMATIDSKVPEFKLEIFASTGIILLALIGIVISSLAVFAEVTYILQQRRLEISKNKTIAEAFRGEKFVMCFSLRENFPRVLKATAPKDFVPVIAGLRTIVCLWVTLLHIYYHSMFTRNNIQFLYAKLESFILQPILQACFYVDVFFTISGFLLAYNLLTSSHHVETIKSNTFFQNVKLYVKLVIHRHFRLMPVFILTMVDTDLYCKETWWYNLLYINNALPLSRMCSSWGWYIACEMQFYICFLAIMFIYIKNEGAGKALFISSGIIMVTVSFFCYYSNGITFQIDVISLTTENVYIKPWTRVPPYFGGVFMGWFLYRIRNSTVKLSTLTRTTFWVVAIVIHLATIFMSYWKTTPVWLVSSIMSFGKVLFGIFIGSLISICQLGYGGAFAKVMGSRLFLYLNKFSFSMYMVAPIVITILFGLRTEPSTFNELTAASEIFAVIFISHIFSVVITLFIEIPFQRLSSQYILKRV
ncbi:unnamed protein product [Hermetia illucens]|uniref:Nose resistant-to-fluoxetine protein N-terminal domain-containing protein n=1 Tax=Hermetia illucens TaxID=343691 RepID=A0A7R8YME0_HERIL|nr:unnamed protein product [Hermetia illucens]